jgi:hypothetical protein
MSDVTRALHILDSPDLPRERQVAQKLLIDLLDADGKVRFKSIVSFHDHVCRSYGFALREKAQRGVRPGGWHLIYSNGSLLLRVKTSGTGRRPSPHMTLSLAVGLLWPDESAKFNREGQVVPRVGAVPRLGSDWRNLQRLGDSVEAIEAADDRWANACHFDFVAGFDGSGAAALAVRP